MYGIIGKKNTFSHVFPSHVFILHTGLRFPDGKLVLLPRRPLPNTNIPTGKKLEISFQKSRNTSFQTNVLAENHLNIWTKVSVWKPRWHNSALCHPGPQLQKVSDPGFVPMCSSLYSPVGFVIFPLSFIFLAFFTISVSLIYLQKTSTRGGNWGYANLSLGTYLRILWAFGYICGPIIWAI